jgi:hypothetical protein
VENINQVVKRVLWSVLAKRRLIGQHPNWAKDMGTVAATINSQHGWGKHDTSAFEAVYGQKYNHPMLCSKEEACKCWTLPDHLHVANNDVFNCILHSTSMWVRMTTQAPPTLKTTMSLVTS